MAFGISWDPEQNVIGTSVSEVAVDFLATDTAAQILEKIRSAPADGGWTVAVNAGRLEITANGAGDHVYSLRHSIAYPGDGANGDHWTFEDGD